MRAWFSRCVATSRTSMRLRPESARNWKNIANASTHEYLPNSVHRNLFRDEKDRRQMDRAADASGDCAEDGVLDDALRLLHRIHAQRSAGGVLKHGKLLKFLLALVVERFLLIDHEQFGIDRCQRRDRGRPATCERAT